ncbi:MAG: hypothetical protein WA117_00765 [Verrucomicrobiia bacterium]
MLKASVRESDQEPGAVRGRKVIVNYKGRLGNQLFQFAIGWVLAQTAEAPLSARPIQGFSGTRGFDGERESFQPLHTRGHPIDIEACVQHLRLSGDVVIDGYHQRYEILRPMKHPIKALLSKVEGPKPETMPGPEDLVVQIRLGDYFSPRLVPRYGYPLEDVVVLIRKQRFDRLYLTTDEPSHPFIQRLQSEFGAALGGKHPLEQFAFSIMARRLVVTPSSYSWWAAWLSNAEQVFFPVEKGVWLRKNQVNLWVDDEPRYIPY